MEPFHPLRFPSLLLIILSHVSGYPTPTSGSLPIINSVVLLCVCSVIQNYQPYSGQIDIQTKLEWVIRISEEIGANPDILNGLWSHFNSFLLIIFRAVPTWQKGSLRATLTKCNARSVNYHCRRDRRHNHDYYDWQAHFTNLPDPDPHSLLPLYVLIFFLCSCICGECLTFFGCMQCIHLGVTLCRAA